MSEDKCPLCGANDIEKISDQEFICKSCGLGSNKKLQSDPNFAKHTIQYITNAVNLARAFWPDLSNEELTEKVQFHLHRSEKHPTRPDGYCEYCEKKW